MKSKFQFFVTPVSTCFYVSGGLSNNWLADDLQRGGARSTTWAWRLNKQHGRQQMKMFFMNILEEYVYMDDGGSVALMGLGWGIVNSSCRCSTWMVEYALEQMQDDVLRGCGVSTTWHVYSFRRFVLVALFNGHQWLDLFYRRMQAPPHDLFLGMDQHEQDAVQINVEFNSNGSSKKPIDDL
ncbi:hypothetical protein Mgra_00000824 [Meloidogyne graminicola]|uniref:Uncharacterized protein n=1 Tax=Meloidogyne graminicola TaxID=189291 RepID=A0A8T0A4Q0_9BILA|nr:hypothetical protein Mgra_00000824 [Meloidogyne graminicola]